MVEKYLDCGNPRCGFARIRCPDCHTEHLLMFSCRTRCFVPSLTSDEPQFTIPNDGMRQNQCQGRSLCRLGRKGNYYQSLFPVVVDWVLSLFSRRNHHLD